VLRWVGLRIRADLPGIEPQALGRTGWPGRVPSRVVRPALPLGLVRWDDSCGRAAEELAAIVQRPCAAARPFL